MPRISIKAPALPEVVEPLAESTPLCIGRTGGENDLPIEDDRLSRTHCRISPEEDGWCVEDLASANGTFVNGIRITRPYWLLSGDTIEIGGTRILYIAETEADDDSIAPEQTVCETDLDTPVPEIIVNDTQPHYVLQYLKGEKRRLLRLTEKAISIGRHPSCSLVFDDASLSLHHARVERRDDGYYVIDTESTNGVYVNGRLVKEERLRPGTRIRFGRAVLGFKELVPRPNLPGE